MKGLKSKKIIWAINFIIFAVVVFLGIQQGGKGAEISRMENQIKGIEMAKQHDIEQVLLSSNTDEIEKKASELGFNKPSSVVYIDSQEMLTSNLVR